MNIDEEIKMLSELQSDHTRWFTQNEFDRLKQLRQLVFEDSQICYNCIRISRISLNINPMNGTAKEQIEYAQKCRPCKFDK